MMQNDGDTGWTSRDSRLLRFGVPFLLALALYFIAGFYIDIPPYGILLEDTRTLIYLDTTSVKVESRLVYYCRTWRPRQNAVYLPFSSKHGEGPVRKFSGSVEAPSRYDLCPDGVILHLVMKPRSRQTVRFSFEQELPRKRYYHSFDVSMGWAQSAKERTYEVEVDRKKANYVFSPPPAGEKSLGGTRVRYLIPVREGRGLSITWE